MFPHTLSEWSAAVINDLLTADIYESDRFELKQTLPHSQALNVKDRLRRTCSAFANAGGGFLVFGISDDRNKSPKDRFVGIDSSYDFPRYFGDYPRNCSPSIEWTFRNPPIQLESGKVLHVIEIFKSWKAPHAVGDRDKGWHFTKRTNKGNEGMSIDEVRSAFLGFYEKRLKLQLLSAELLTLREIASSAYITDEATIDSSHSLVTFDLQVIESIVADTYSITANDIELLRALSVIRRKAKIANNKIQILFGVVAMPMSNMASMVKKHNEYMRPVCEELVKLCDVAIARLDNFLGA